ncbi:MAG: cobalamin biosynthesis protein CbiG [Chromatiaceae bacterium]|nr:MAG: cobalamin biosynthesis protein CbiG [Chromatiaceae bacterium]
MIRPRPPSNPTQPRLVIGLGCDRGSARASLEQALTEALVQVGAEPAQIALLASIDLKANEPGLLALARHRGWPLRCYPAAALAAVAVPNPSLTVRRHTGTGSVSAAAALLAAGVTGPPWPDLLLEKYRRRDASGRHVTISIVRLPEHVMTNLAAIPAKVLAPG